MGYPEQRPRASGGYQDDSTIPDNGGYADDLSPTDYSGSAGDLADRYEDTADGNTADGNTADGNTADGYDDDDYDESDDLDILGDDELYDDPGEYYPAGQPGEENGQGPRPGLMG